MKWEASVSVICHCPRLRKRDVLGAIYLSIIRREAFLCLLFRHFNFLTLYSNFSASSTTFTTTIFEGITICLYWFNLTYNSLKKIFHEKEIV